MGSYVKDSCIYPISKHPSYRPASCDQPRQSQQSRHPARIQHLDHHPAYLPTYLLQISSSSSSRRIRYALSPFPSSTHRPKLIPRPLIWKSVSYTSSETSRREPKVPYQMIPCTTLEIQTEEPLERREDQREDNSPHKSHTHLLALL